VITDGGSTVFERGVCWGTGVNPNRNSINHTSDGGGTGRFTSQITGLIINQTYHVRAYATNDEGTSYGETVEFTTSPANEPTVVSGQVLAVSSNSVSAEGIVTDDGGATIIEQGVVCGLNPSPVLDINDDTIGISLYYGTGKYSCIVNGLKPDTKYYARTFATNQAGTAYGSVFSFTTSSTITDLQGRVYNTVIIANQTWMAENLSVTSLNDGTGIHYESDLNNWAQTTDPAYCWFLDDSLSHRNTLGALYNWYTVNTGKLCPTGWHVPDDADWNILVNYLGGEAVAGGRMTYNGINAFLFSALEGGLRDPISGYSAVPCSCCVGTEPDNVYFWSADESSPNLAWARSILESAQIFRNEFGKNYGMSVRCIKD
jgi:uncharacterized protein (TIGR02145 family)